MLELKLDTNFNNQFNIENIQNTQNIKSILASYVLNLITNKIEKSDLVFLQIYQEIINSLY